MFRKSLLLVSWFPLTFILLIINLYLLTTLAGSANGHHPLNASVPQDTSFQLTAAGGGTSQVLSASIVAGDSRVLLIESFLRRHKSPMAPYADAIVSEADRFAIDFRLIPAIAMCESSAGKRMPKKDEFNFAGIAVYTGQNHGKAFESWPQSIAWVSQYIKEHYYDRGYTDLYDIGAIWAPPSVNTGYSWTNCVKSFQDAII
jgi:hypothetical protein